MQRMTDDVHPRAQPVLAFLLTIAMAIWVGGSIMVDFAVVPTVFDQLSRRDAGDVGIVLFAKINHLESVLGAASILLAFAMGRSAWGTRTRHITATSLVVGMTVIAVIFLVLFTPAIGHRWTELVSSGVDLQDPADRPPARAELRTLHTIYAGFDVLKILAGIGILWLLATRRQR